MKAKRKLTLILRSKPVRCDGFIPGSLVQVYIKSGKEKKCKWSSDKVMLSFDSELDTVTVPGSNRQKINAAAEDVRPSLPKDCFSQAVHESIDALDRAVSIEIEENFDETLDCTNHAMENNAVKSDDIPLNDYDFGCENSLPSVGDSI